MPIYPGTLSQTRSDLVLARVHDGGLLAVLDLARSAAGGLEGADDLLRLLVGDLAKDNVAAIEPLSLDGGDEELRAVAIGCISRKLVLGTNIKDGSEGTHVLGPALAMESR